MIAKKIEDHIFSQSAPHRINYVTPVAQEEAEGLTAEVYRQMRRDFQIVPPLTLHSPLPKLLAAVWAISREALIAGPVDRSEREIVAAAISRINECPFCVEVHTTMLFGAGHSEIAKSLLLETHEGRAQERGYQLARWAMATRTPGAKALRTPPFSATEAPELIGTAVAFHYINRVVNVFLDASPLPVSSIPRWMKAPFGQVAGRLFGKRIIGLSVVAGESLPLLKEGDLPKEFAWARGNNEAVAGAFSRLASTMEEIGQAVVPTPVRELVEAYLSSWNGADPGISRQWVENAIADLPDDDQPCGRLALLSAIASHQVDADVIQAFRQHVPSDEALIGTVAWGSYLATRRISGWLNVSLSTPSITQQETEPCQ